TFSYRCVRILRFRAEPVSDEEDLSAEQPPPQTNAWLPCPDGYARGARRLEAASRQAAPAPDGHHSAEAAWVKPWPRRRATRRGCACAGGPSSSPCSARGAVGTANIWWSYADRRLGRAPVSASR